MSAIFQVGACCDSFRRGRAVGQIHSFIDYFDLICGNSGFDHATCNEFRDGEDAFRGAIAGERQWTAAERIRDAALGDEYSAAMRAG